MNALGAPQLFDDNLVVKILDRKSINSLEDSSCDQHDIKQIKVNISQLHNKYFPDRQS